MSHEMLTRILSRAKSLELTPRGASIASGLSATAIRDLIRKPNQSPSLATIKKLAKGLQTTPEWIAYGTDNGLVPAEAVSEVQEVKTRFVRAIYGGVVEAGSFRSVDEFDDEEHVRTPQFEQIDDEFPDAKIVVFDVSGDSMNALKPNPIPPGFKVACLEFESLKNRAPVRDGMVVVVEQRLKGGLLRERSVKQIELYRDRTEYCPRSTNPKHKPIVVPFDQDLDDGREVEILAIVKRITSDVAI